MRFLVTGASGFLGRALVPHLRAQGHDVRILVRHPPRAPDEAAWDPEAGRLAADALEGIDAVVHLAGASIAAGRWTRRRRDLILASRVRGTNLLASRMVGLDRPPRTFVSMSATGFHGDGGDQDLDEDGPAGGGFLAQVCAAWEAAADPARAAGIQVVHPRPHYVLGRGGGPLPPLVRLYRLGLGGRLGRGDQWISWISATDCVRALLFLVEGGLEGPAHLTAPQPVTQRAFARTLARVLHRPALVPAPAFAIRALLGRMGRELLLEGQRSRTPARGTARAPAPPTQGRVPVRTPRSRGSPTRRARVGPPRWPQ